MIYHKLEQMAIKESQFANKNKKNYIVSYIFWYTLIFSVLLILTFCSFYKNGKGFVWAGAKKDGLVQHFNVLAYYGNYLRNIIRSVTENGTLTIPAYDFSIGLGGDILSTFQYYVIGDPLNLLAAAVPQRYTEFLYEFLIILRIYLAGITFSSFCFSFKKDRFAVMIGAYLYAFSSFALYAAIRHPFFGNALLYLPLVLLGVERIFRGKRPYIYILSVFLAASSNFYFFYMISIFMVIYAGFRFFMIYKEHRIICFMKNILRFGIYYVTGLAMAGILFMPMAGTLFSSSRIHDGMSFSLFYPMQYYQKLAALLLTYGPAGKEWVVCAVTPLQFVCILLLFRKKENHPALQRAFCLLSVFLLFPVFGSVFNGFGYVANRWSFAYCFLTSFIVVMTLKDVWNISPVFRRKILCAALCVSILAVLPDFQRSAKTFAAAALLLSGVIAMDLCFFEKKADSYHSANDRILCLLLLCCILFSEGTIAYEISGYQKQFTEFGSAGKTLKNSALKGAEEFSGSTGFKRFEEAADWKGFLTNQNIVHGVSSTCYYWSLANPYYYEYTSGIGGRDNMEQALKGLDGKANALALANVNYYLANMKNPSVPYGFAAAPEKIVTVNGEQIGYFKNELALPFGYTYDNYISRRQYDRLDHAARQQAAMQSVVLEKENPLPENKKPELAVMEFPYTISGKNTILNKNGTYISEKKNQKLEITASIEDGYEVHAYFDGLKYTPVNDLKLHKLSGKYDSMRKLKKRLIKRESQNWAAPASSHISVSYGNVTKSIEYRTKNNNYYTDRTNYDINLGNGSSAVNTLTVKFGQKGAYQFGDLKIVGLSMEKFAEQIRKLSEETLHNVRFDTDRITGDITVSKDKFLCLSIPYSDGWKAYVDGKEAEIYQANVGYMGVMLSKGRHHIEMKYETPWLRTGIYCSIAGMTAFLCVALVTERKRKRSDRKADR